MRILVIGGTGFIGRFVVRDLLAQGHQVAVYHRFCSEKAPLEQVLHILGDRNDLARHRHEFERFSAEVVLDMILSSERQAKYVVATFRSIAGRVVVLSSQDVYRACGVLHGLEPGPLQPMPLTEESDLRTRLNTYGPETIRMLRKIFPWLDDEYDKIPVERVVMSESELPGTVLRLPMVYGPGDPLHRFFPIIKRIDDRRPSILIQEDAARWKGTRGYVENVAAAVVLAVTSADAAGRKFNVGEMVALSEEQWARKIGRVMGWAGTVMTLPKERMPAHLQVPFNSEQHWVVSTERVRKELGYSEPVPLEIALERTIAWERANPPQEIDPKLFDYPAEDACLTHRAP